MLEWMEGIGIGLSVGVKFHTVIRKSVDHEFF